MLPSSSLRCFSLLLLIASPIWLPQLRADDWPHWMGPSRDNVWHEGNIIRRFPDGGPRVKFRQPVGAGYAGSAVSEGRLFVMDRTQDEGVGISTENDIRDKGAIAGGERIQCLDAASGAPVWEYTYDCPYRIAYPTGPRCTPTVDGDVVYTLGAMGDLLCLNAETGKIVWQNKLTKTYETRPPLWGYASHPLIDGNQLFVPVGGEGHGVVCFDKTNGKELWAAVTTKDVGYAPLVIREPETKDGQRQLIFWHAEGVTSLNLKTGEQFWVSKFPAEPSPSVVTISTPVFDGNRLLITDFYVGSLVLEVSSNPPSFKELWRGNGEVNPKPSSSNGMMNCMMSTAVVKDGIAWGVAHSRRGHGVMRCIDLSNGKQIWEDDKWANGEKSLMFANGFLTENEDLTFVLNDLGDLIIAKISKDGFEELDRAHILKPTSVARGRDVVWSAPAYANGCMFVRNDEEIVCVDLKK